MEAHPGDCATERANGLRESGDSRTLAPSGTVGLVAHRSTVRLFAQKVARRRVPTPPSSDSSPTYFTQLGTGVVNEVTAHQQNRHPCIVRCYRAQFVVIGMRGDLDGKATTMISA